MSVCPKCGRAVIRGPLYERDCYGERLRYTCFTCGYSSVTPTKDAIPPVEIGPLVVGSGNQEASAERAQTTSRSEAQK